MISLLPEVSLATPPLEARSAPTSITALRPQFIIREVVEVVQNSLRSLRRARNGRGGPRQLRGLVTQCLSEATRAWAALRRCPRPPQHPRGAAPARQHAIEAEGTWVYAENGRSAARQPRGPLTRCIPEVPPASDHLRRRAPAAPPPRKPTSSEHHAKAPSGCKRRAYRREQSPPTPGPPHQVSTRGAPRLSSPPPARSRSAAASQAHLTQEHQRGGALGRQKTGMPAGAGPANPGPPSPGVYPRCPPPRLASDGALPQRRRLARSASSERQREGPRAAKDGRAGGSRARQPRGPLTRCLSEVPPASARLRRRAPALSRLCRGYQPTIAPWLFEGPRSRSSAKIREIYIAQSSSWEKTFSGRTFLGGGVGATL